ncbi:hypothetical protein M0R45_014370 [Rubus argutus]|uniref:PGG domain-containing protein n=1 Tax=Rubus argutus TaxID=59490 RepID=A0AAW1XPS1_RUBAR
MNLRGFGSPITRVKTPLHVAARVGCHEIDEFVIDHSKSFPLEGADQESGGATDAETYKQLLRMGTNDVTALHAAVTHQYLTNGGIVKTMADVRINVVKFILKTPKLAGLINEADKDGNTPLHLAAIHQNRTIIRILTQDRRVDMFAINKESSVALDIFLGHNFGQQEISDNSRTILDNLRCSVGVPYLQQEMGRDLKKLTSLEKNTSDDTLAMVGKRENPQADSDLGLKRYDNKLLVATLIATVTFCSGFNQCACLEDLKPTEHQFYMNDHLRHISAFKLCILYSLCLCNFQRSVINPSPNTCKSHSVVHWWNGASIFCGHVSHAAETPR